MDDCPPFLIYLGDKVAELMPLIRSEMARKGAAVNGNDTQGEFRVNTPFGGLCARYQLRGKSVEVAIITRPRGVSCAQIQDKMTDSILDAKAMLKSG